MQILNKEDDEISEIQFESYELDLTPYYEKGIKDIYPEERSSQELILKIKSKIYSSEEFGELQNRIINPIYIFILSILPLLTFKIMRRPDSKWTIPIIIISTVGLFIKFFEITMASGLISNNSFIMLNYLFPIIIIFILLIFLYSEKSHYSKLKALF